MTRLTVLFAVVCASAPAAQAHYNMLLPQSASAKRGDTVVFTYQWGHPFEHQLFDAPSPKSVVVLTPDGKQAELTSTLEKTYIPAAHGKEVTAWRFRFKADLRGDYVFFLSTPPIWMEEEQEYWQDTVKVVLHVQAQKGWDAALGSGFELVPLTRPYGLQPGIVFQAEINAQPASKNGGAGALIEIERYNHRPPKNLPPDEHITRTVKTDRNGVLTCTLADPGWWCITAQRHDGQLARNGKEYPLRRRTTFWVFVDEKTISEASK
ncbi:MAG TPA: DUF4198 domain-containing protein [Gemmataceae bacterium]|nr:DUF4198 domain-containing protein [Gemmataceae bacterium]